MGKVGSGSNVYILKIFYNHSNITTITAALRFITTLKTMAAKTSQKHS